MFSLTVDRAFDIDLDTMWRLWTEPEHMAVWFRPSLTEFGPTLAQVDLRPGGAYRVEMVRPDGVVHATVGTYVTIERPTLLGFTWRWDGADDAAESYVEVRFAPDGARTTVTIDHTRLATQESADEHARGWAGCLASLAASYDASPASH